MYKIMKKRKAESQKDFAKRLGVHPVYLNAILSKSDRKNKRLPSIELAIRIERESDGQYKATDLRPDLKGIVNDIMNCRL